MGISETLEKPLFGKKLFSCYGCPLTLPCLWA